MKKKQLPPSPQSIKDETLVPVQIAYGAKERGKMARSAGGTWDADVNLWYIRYGSIKGTEQEKHIFCYIEREHMINKINNALSDGFETALFGAALKNLADTGNLLRFNNFSYAMRELTRHILHRLAPDEKVLGCSWHKNETKVENGITRYQRAYFAVQGGLGDEYVRDVLEIEVAEIHQRLIKAIGKLSKYTHIEPSTFDLPTPQVDSLVSETLESFASFLATVAECRKTILDRLWAEIDSSVVDEVLKETINSIDEISSHHYIYEVYTNNVVIDSIDDQSIHFVAEGTIGCQLQWGSNSDVRRGDGAILSKSFPFKCNLISQITDPEAIEVIEDTLGVDMSSWHGSD